MSFEIDRPEHLGDDAWAAIDSHRDRLERSALTADAPAVLGNAKELIESIARVVLEARGITVSDRSDMPKLLNEAQHALERQAGRDVAMTPELRVVASSALNIALKVSEIRNQEGTGHGRARLSEIREEMVTVVSDAAMLWSRWALRRLGHILAGEIDLLIADVLTVFRRDEMREKFEAVLMPEHAPEDQQRLGVAFGQRAAGGFGNAWEVGILGATETDDLRVWPIAYRLGVVQGLIIDNQGQVNLPGYGAKYVVRLIRPLPPNAVSDAFRDLGQQVATASWNRRRSWGETPDPEGVIAELRAESANLEDALREPVTGLIDVLETAALTSDS